MESLKGREKMNNHVSIVKNIDRPSIYLRTFSLSLSDDLPQYWVNDDPYSTHMLNAFSCIFPGGERFFVRSVLRFQNQIKDSRLKRDVRQFCGQESLHEQQHEAYNYWAQKRGLPLEEMTQKFDDLLLRNAHRSSAIFKLSITVALEHFTAVMGRALLSSDSLRDKFHPAIRPLWIWHAIEEIEHKSVAYEVLQQVDRRYWTRFSGMIVAIVSLMASTAVLMAILLWREKKLFHVKSLWRWLRMLYETDFLKNVGVGVLKYFRAEFHPWEVDDRELIAKFIPKIQPFIADYRVHKKESA